MITHALIFILNIASARFLRHRLPDGGETFLVRIRGRTTQVAHRVGAKTRHVNAPILFEMQFNIADLELIRAAMRSELAGKGGGRLDKVVDEFEQQIFNLGL